MATKKSKKIAPKKKAAKKATEKLAPKKAKKVKKVLKVAKPKKPGKAIAKIIAGKTNPAHRPAKVLNAVEVQLMSMYFCTIEEIALAYQMTERQLYRRMAQDPSLRIAFQAGRAAGRRSLKRKQFQVAVNEGSEMMLKWLGQNELGQASNAARQTPGMDEEQMDDALDVEFEEIYGDVEEVLNNHGIGPTATADKPGPSAAHSGSGEPTPGEDVPGAPGPEPQDSPGPEENV